MSTRLYLQYISLVVFLLLHCSLCEMADTNSSALPQLLSSNQAKLDLEDKLYLEDFINPSIELKPNEKVENLSLSISFQHVQSKDLYTKAVKNLKSTIPSVKIVTFNGGYVYDPREDNVEVFKQEVHDLKTHFGNLAEVFHAENLPVESVNFSGLQTFKGETVDQANFTQLFTETFNAHFTPHMIENRQVDFEYEKAGIRFTIKLSFSITLLKGSEEIRARFYDAKVSINQ